MVAAQQKTRTVKSCGHLQLKTSLGALSDFRAGLSQKRVLSTLRYQPFDSIGLGKGFAQY